MTEARQSSTGWNRLMAFRARHAKAQVVLFFLAGFAADVLTLRRIDNTLTLAKHGAFLVLLTALLVLDQRRELLPPKRLKRILPFTLDAIHFLLGSLLSAFTVLYFKSASGIGPLAFLAGLLALLVANEVPAFRRLGPTLRFGLYSFCVTSYLAYLFPVLLGYLSPWLFVAAAGVSLLSLYAFFRRLHYWTLDAKEAARRVVLGIAMQAVLVGLYMLQVIPPVPVSVQFMGIYHRVERANDAFHLFHQPPGWKVWQHGDQDFHARPGDRVFCFVRIFAPTRFKEQVRIRWSYRDAKGRWSSADAIPMAVSGGRDEGYRGYAFKQNYQPGRWKVQVEMEDGREIGELKFTVTPDAETGERAFLTDVG